MSTPASSLPHALTGPIADAAVSARGRRLLATVHAQCAQTLGGPLRLTTPL